jgi:hypothetical protein
MFFPAKARKNPKNGKPDCRVDLTRQWSWPADALARPPRRMRGFDRESTPLSTRIGYYISIGAQLSLVLSFLKNKSLA